MPVYRPPFIKQLDGSTYAGLNCTMASACMAAIRHRRGSNPAGTAPWYPTPSYLRRKTGDTSGGTNLSQADSALISAYGINLDVEYGMSFSELRRRVTSGAGAILQGGYAPIRSTKYSGSATFHSNHAVYVNETRWNNTYNRWEWLWYDPLCDGRYSGIPRGPQWMPDSLVYKFAGALTIYGTTKLGVGRAYAALTRDTEVVILKYGAKVLSPTITIQAKVSANVYRSATTQSDVARGIAAGQLFKAYQRTSIGGLLGGSRVWYGNADGTQWVHTLKFRKV